MAHLFIIPYKEDVDNINREVAINDYNDLINADGGSWSEAEVLGNRAIVKVNATQATIDTIVAAEPTYFKLPTSNLNESVSDLTNAQRNAIKNKILDQGYTLAEINSKLTFSAFSSTTIWDVLNFMATRRIKSRFDHDLQQFVFDGPVQVCKSIDKLNSEV